MFVEKVKSEGLAHLSYLVGDGDAAAVVDPRRDCEIYIRMARERGCRITDVFETHRNEDLVSGAPVLARSTGARVHHGPNAAGDVAYADTVREGEDFAFGKLRLEVLETPGHTDDSLSFALFDTSFGQEAVGVFTGDALFVGDVGRTDFYPERAEEVAGLLFDSLRRILALGDQALVWPAHGAGSVCGDAMADREFSTLGFERHHNPKLAIGDRRAFVEAKLAERHAQPPYFRRMERLNLEGAGPPRSFSPPAVPVSSLPAPASTTLVDVRSVAAFQGAHLEGSLSLPLGMLSAFAGWILDPDGDLLLVADDAEQASSATRLLARIGFDRVVGFIGAPFPAAAVFGLPFERVPTIGVSEVFRRVEDRPPGWTLLDVRAPDEVEDGVVEGARPVYVGRLPDALDSLDRSRHYTAMCESGARATIAAAVLLRAGFEQVDVFLGSMGAWQHAGHPVVKPDSSPEW